MDSKESLYIILNNFKKGNLTEDEAAHLIEDLYDNKTTYIPQLIPTNPYWPQVTYEAEPKIQKFEVTCKQ